MKVQSAPVEAVSRNLRFSRCSLVHCHFVGAFPVPLWRDPERHRPVRWALENGGISVVPHLVSVVFELLSKRAQLRPCLMARGTWHAIFSCECGKSAGLTAGRK